MQLSHALTLVFAALVAGSPVAKKTLDTRDAGSIAECETQAVAEQTSCSVACGQNTTCITNCASVAIQKYQDCASR